MPFLLYGYTDVRVLCANNNNTHTNGRRKESVWRNRLLSLTHSFLLTPFPPLPPWFINQKKPEKKPFAFFLFLRLRFHFAPAHTQVRTLLCVVIGASLDSNCCTIGRKEESQNIEQGPGAFLWISKSFRAKSVSGSQGLSAAAELPCLEDTSAVLFFFAPKGILL